MTSSHRGREGCSKNGGIKKLEKWGDVIYGWSLSNNYGPAPLQHDWSQKNNLWNPAASATNSFGAPPPIPPPTVVPSAGGHQIGHPAPPPLPVSMVTVVEFDSVAA